MTFRFASSMTLLVALSGCAGQETRGRADSIRDIVDAARKNGAYVCAPKELALAEAHLQRTGDELALGNLLPARDHLQIADTNARLAFSKSPPNKCAPKKDTDRDGLSDDVDKCPLRPEDKDGFEDQDGCPDLDNDHDGIPDARDRCPNEPEDADGFEDEDGCPDPDNDKDTVVDLKDKCPNEPGPVESDGCPQKYKLVTVTDQKIELKQTVHFATNRTQILSISFPLLNEVAQVLKDRPTVSVRIEGHTDSRGNDAYNLKLSQGRADSVRTYLVGRGIASDRMEAVGYGENRPIADNRTRAGRALNRRVEFFITKQ